MAAHQRHRKLVFKEQACKTGDETAVLRLWDWDSRSKIVRLRQPLWGCETAIFPIERAASSAPSNNSNMQQRDLLLEFHWSEPSHCTTCVSVSATAVSHWVSLIHFYSSHPRIKLSKHASFHILPLLPSPSKEGKPLSDFDNTFTWDDILGIFCETVAAVQFWWNFAQPNFTVSDVQKCHVCRFWR